MPHISPQTNYEVFSDEVYLGNPSEIRLAKIIRQLEADKKIFSSNAELREVLGVAFLRSKKYEKAIRELSASFNISPSNRYAHNLLLCYHEACMYSEGLKFNLKNIKYAPEDIMASVILTGDYNEEEIDILNEEDALVIKAAFESGLQKELTDIFRILIKNSPEGSSHSLTAEKEEGEWVIDITTLVVGDEQSVITSSINFSKLLSEQYNSEVLMRIVPLFELQKAA